MSEEHAGMPTLDELRAAYEADRREAFREAQERLIGRTIVSVRGLCMNGLPSDADSIFRGHSLRGVQLVLDDGTTIESEDFEGDDTWFVITRHLNAERRSE